MSWTNQNAANRIFNVFKRFQERKGTLYEKDIEALKTINTALENCSKEHVNDNLLYAKVLAICLVNELRYTRDIKDAMRCVSSDIRKPLNYHLDFLRMHLNEIDLEAHFRYLGMLDFDFWDVTQETRDKKAKIIQGIEPEMIDKIKHSWTLENVKKSFYKTANEFLQDVGNYK